MGDCTTSKAYRLISLLSKLRKVLERILAIRLNHLAKTQLFFSDTQIKNWQTVSAKTEAQALIKCIYKAWNIKKIETLLLPDFPAAFDNMSHAKPIHNLKNIRYQKL